MKLGMKLLLTSLVGLGINGGVNLYYQHPIDTKLIKTDHEITPLQKDIDDFHRFQDMFSVASSQMEDSINTWVIRRDSLKGESEELRRERNKYLKRIFVFPYLFPNSD